MPTTTPPEAPGGDRGVQPRSSATGLRWQRELAEAVRDPEELCRLLHLDPAVAATARQSLGGFPLLVPRGFVARMEPGNRFDPLLLQVLPVAEELVQRADYSPDPLEEQGALRAPGLVQKYAGRALLLATGACAINCRYCFRRSFPYAENGATQAGMAAAVEAIASDATISEVILSGGDPLLLDDDRLGRLVDSLAAIPTLRRLRIHSRLPIVLPARITEGLVEILARSRLTAVLVVHANHAAELDSSVAQAVRRVAAGGVLLLNQSVLLRGVNDSVAALVALSERLVDLGILPYYLHLLDRVQGAAHFDIAEDQAAALHSALRTLLPGYAVPRLAREVPGEPAKVWLG